MRNCLDCVRSVLVKFILVTLAFIAILVFLDHDAWQKQRNHGLSSALATAEQYDQIFQHLNSLRKETKANLLVRTAALTNHSMAIKSASVYHHFVSRINTYALYHWKRDATIVEQLLQSMATAPLSNIKTAGEYGTQMKFIFEFQDGTVAAVKPMRMKREQEVPNKVYHFSEYERHNAEIASFHLDRLLGFNRATPCVGRLLNITKDLVPFVNDQFLATVHRSPAGNVCFYGQCIEFCNVHHAICGNPDLLEISVCALLPVFHWPFRFFESPWKRAYPPTRAADWQKKENNDTYCQKVLKEHKQQVVLDMIDVHVMDFLSGNLDRHHFESFDAFGNKGTILLLDNGRGFGRSFDVLDILAPLYQCCKIRKSTYQKLRYLATGAERLSSLMRYSLQSDPLHSESPLLAEKHLEALDRRVQIILDTIAECELKKPISEIVIDDL